MKRTSFFKLLNFWPPYVGAGIRVKDISPDFRSIQVEMKLRFWNQNYVHVHFGGSLYSMVDPFFMLMLMENLGQDYIVWDKAASIRFIKPGRGKVHAHFQLAQEQLDKIRKQAAENRKSEPVFEVEILDEAGQAVARVEKTVYVKSRSSAAKEKGLS